MGRSNIVVGAVLVALAVAFAPTIADAARAGGGSSIGSRGARTYQAPQATPTAPQTQNIQRSVTPTQPNAASPATAQAGAGAGLQPRPSFFGGGFMAGMMGGLIGVGLGGLLFGNGFLGSGFGGMSGMLGLLLQLGLIFLVVRLVMGWLRNRNAAQANNNEGYAFASRAAAPDAMQRRSVTDVPPIDLGAPSGRAAGAAPAASVALRDEVGVKPADYDEFEKLLIAVQSAWSAGDVAAMRRQVTPELLSYLSEQMTASSSAGLVNHVEDVNFEDGDLAEAWTEGDLQFATVAMRWTALDYTTRADDGRIVEGRKDERASATEVWTFVRAPGGRWLLSAIQQV